MAYWSADATAVVWLACKRSEIMAKMEYNGLNTDTVRVAQIGTFDLENYGDLLFPFILENELNKRVKSIEIDLFSPVGGRMPFSQKVVHRIGDLERMC